MYPSDWNLTVEKGGLRLCPEKITPIKNTKIPFISITWANEKSPVKPSEQRAIYRTMATGFDREYPNQFKGFKKELAMPAWFNDTLGLRYRFTFSNSKKDCFINEQYMTYIDTDIHTIMLVCPEKDYDKYSGILADITATFAQINRLSSKGVKLYTRAMNEYVNANYAKAENSFKKYIEKAGIANKAEENNFNSSAHTYMALTIQAAHAFNRIQESSNLFGRACQINGDNFPALNQLAGCWAAVADLKTKDGIKSLNMSLKLLDDSLGVNPAWPETLYLKAVILINSGNPDKAIPLLQQAVANDSRYKKAVSALSKIIK